MDDIPRIRSYLVWVLVPSIETSDPNLQYYYDFTQSLEEYTRAFDTLGITWKWQPVTMGNMESVIASIRDQSDGRPPIVLNLCDGDEVNGTPGISVIHLLENHDLPYTGSDALFYHLTTSKITMKRAFDEAGIPHAPWAVLEDLSPDGLFDRVGTPAIIKPAVSGGSMGLTVRNVVSDHAALVQRISELTEGYHGWDITSGGLILERFIKGPEYTVFLIGSSDTPDTCIVYEPAERVFHQSLPETERFLSFDRLWEMYDRETPMPNEDDFYKYKPVNGDLSEAVKQMSIEAYCAVKGQGYGRVDVRMDSETGKLYVLEVNAQCGLSEDEDYTSIGAILRFSKKSFATLVEEVIYEALDA